MAITNMSRLAAMRVTVKIFFPAARAHIISHHISIYRSLRLIYGAVKQRNAAACTYSRYRSSMLICALLRYHHDACGYAGFFHSFWATSSTVCCWLCRNNPPAWFEQRRRRSSTSVRSISIAFNRRHALHDNPIDRFYCRSEYRRWTPRFAPRHVSLCRLP